MKLGAEYRKLDFVEYFKALSQVQDSWIDEFSANPRCIAALDAFTSNSAVLGIIAFFVGEQMRLHATMCLELVKHMGRLSELSESDPRYIAKGDATELVNSPLSAQSYWEIDPRPEGWGLYRKGLETERRWNEILRSDRHQYIEHWKLAHYNEYAALLADRELLARIDADIKTKDDHEPWDRTDDLTKAVDAHALPLEPSLKALLIGRLFRDIDRGIVVLPCGLESEFPAIYAGRGGP